MGRDGERGALEEWERGWQEEEREKKSEGKWREKREDRKRGVAE